ncbi:hypothetical protein ACLMAJ_14330 [Nocardia sp. KC 131]|uniref:hypothetical protein n=1 Tax=Nocardia arseniciresistens TaxID=3392119 RepID=UPI00398F6B08
MAVGTETEENLPKSRRSRRDRPPPPDVTEALDALMTLQKTECRAMRIPWTDDRLIVVHEDGTPVRPEWYSDAAWHGHDPAVSLSIYSDAQPEDLKAAGAALFK